MHIFQDKNGRDWSFELTLLVAQQIEKVDFSDIHPKGLKKLSLVALDNDDDAASLMLNPAIVGAIAYFGCKASRTQYSVDSQEAFLDLLNGPAIESMKLAVWGEMANFFPQLRTIFQTLIANYSSLVRTVEEVTTKHAARILSPENLRTQLENEISEKLGKASTHNQP